MQEKRGKLKGKQTPLPKTLCKHFMALLAYFLLLLHTRRHCCRTPLLGSVWGGSPLYYTSFFSGHTPAFVAPWLESVSNLMPRTLRAHLASSNCRRWYFGSLLTPLELPLELRWHYYP